MVNKKILIPILFFVFLYLSFLGQHQPLVDSLTHLLNTTTKDTNHVNWRNKIAWETMFSNPIEARNQSNMALAIATEKKWDKGIANSYHAIAYTYFIEGNNIEALAFNNKALDIRLKKRDKLGVAKSYGNIGTIYYSINQYPKALEYQLKSLKLNEEVRNQVGIASCLSNIGNIYSNFKKPLESLEYQLKALDIRIQLNDDKGIAGTLGNIGNAYLDLTDKDLFLINLTEKDRMVKVYHYQFESLKKWIEIGELSNVALTYTNIGNLYLLTKNNDSALYYFNKGLNMYSESADQRGVANSLNKLGSIYFVKKDINKALEYLNKSITIAQKIQAIDIEKNASQVLSDLYAFGNNPTKSLLFFKKYVQLKDCLINVDNTRKIIQQQMQYDFDKKTTADSLHNLEQIKYEELKHQQALAIERTYTYGGVFGFLLMIIVAVVFFNSNQQKRKANKQIVLQKGILEEKNKEITDSINYAHKIQHALMASDKLLDDNLKDSAKNKDYFILYKPKDIVSGDYYWAYKPEHENSFIFITADCTGHGVPGAFMSLLCISYLNEVVKEQGITQPDIIFNLVRDKIVANFSANESSERKDGMDAVIYKLNYDTNILEYAAANNPILLLEQTEGDSYQLIELKADKMPVGVTHDGVYKPFKFGEYKLKPNTFIYTFTDGYADQFGGPKGKKFMYKQMRELFTEIASLSTLEQKERLDYVINEWKGNCEQVDDILVVGVKI